MMYDKDYGITAWGQKTIHMERISYQDTNCAQAQNHIQLRIGLVKIHRHVLSPRMVFLIANSNQLGACRT